MTFINEYMKFTEGVWKNPATLTATEFEKELAICALGLSGEAGEVVEKVKKLLHYGLPIEKMDMVKELGDVIYYWTRLCALIQVLPTDVIVGNMDKLTSRKDRGVLHGEGSNR